jgi:hypothetical protein
MGVSGRFELFSVVCAATVTPTQQLREVAKLSYMLVYIVNPLAFIFSRNRSGPCLGEWRWLALSVGAAAGGSGRS